jgi:Fe-S cluster assembly iron-binding protein IscA
MNKVKDSAAKRFKEIAESKGNPPDLCIRLYIAPGG